MSRAFSIRAAQTGFTLIEVMIAMTLGLGTVAVTGWLYMGAVNLYRTHDQMSRLQEGARYAFELMGKDLRMVGTTACPWVTNANVINVNTDWEKDLFRMPIVSVEQDGAAATETEFSDALRVLRADLDREFVVAAHDSVGGVFTLAANHNISTGDYVLATDCNHVSLFQAGVPAANQISHAGGGVPGNSTGQLGAGGLPYAYPAGARLYRLSSVSYFVANNSAGLPSLFRSRPTGASALITREELVEGVEDIQVTYGVDTSAPADGAADFVDPDGDGDPYLTAAQVDSVAVPGVTPADRWARVVSVRISLLMRTVDDNITSDAQNYTYNGVAVASADNRMRKVVTNVIHLRNR
jgi:type IV pilus assembly protein PilW